MQTICNRLKISPGAYPIRIVRIIVGVGVRVVERVIGNLRYSDNSRFI